jgi:hypothetical protein
MTNEEIRALLELEAKKGWDYDFTDAARYAIRPLAEEVLRLRERETALEMALAEWLMIAHRYGTSTTTHRERTAKLLSPDYCNTDEVAHFLRVEEEA